MLYWIIKLSRDNENEERDFPRAVNDFIGMSWWVVRGKTCLRKNGLLSSTISRCLTVLLSIDLFYILDWEKVSRESRFHEWILFKRADNRMIGFARNSRNILYSSFTDGIIDDARWATYVKYAKISSRACAYALQRKWLLVINDNWPWFVDNVYCITPSCSYW